MSPPLATHPAPLQPSATVEPSGPSTSATPPMMPTVAPDTPETSLRKQLKNSDSHWLWKLALRAILILVGIIGIGCAASIVAGVQQRSEVLSYDVFDDSEITWTLITFSVTVIWSFICILVLLLRRPPAPVHPGVQVGIDLVLWLAYIVTALLAVLAVMDAMSWGADGTIGENYGDGYYTYSTGNSSWVWTPSSYGYSYNVTRSCDSDNSLSTFASCADQDSFVNGLWKSKASRVDRIMTATVCQFIALVLHFALFVWACVDTHRRNSRKTTAAAERLAMDIVSKMVDSGALVRNQGTQHESVGPQSREPGVARYA